MRRRQALVMLGTTATGGCLEFTSGEGPIDGTRKTVTEGTKTKTESPGFADDTPFRSADATMFKRWSVEASAVSAAIDDDAVCLTGPTEGDEIWLIDALTGERRWTAFEDQSFTKLNPIFHDDDILVAGTIEGDKPASRLLLLDRNSGAVRQSTIVEGNIGAKSVVTDNIIICGTWYLDSNKNQIYALERDDLSLRWMMEVKSIAGFAGGTILNDMVHVSFSNSMRGYTLADGNEKYRLPDASTPISFEGDLFASVDDQIRRIAPETLEFKWTLGENVWGDLIVTHNIVAAHTENGIVAGTADNGEQLWYRELKEKSGFGKHLEYHNGLLLSHYYGFRGIAPLTGETAFELSDKAWFTSGDAGVVIGDAGNSPGVESVTVYTVEET